MWDEWGSGGGCVEGAKAGRGGHSGARATYQHSPIPPTLPILSLPLLVYVHYHPLIFLLKSLRPDQTKELQWTGVI